ncbi:MAG: ATP-binding protein [Bryobacteraceae bacterium]
MFLKRLPPLTFFRTLRFRLASTFLLILLIILTIVGVAGTVIIKSVLESRTEDTLREELAALKGYLRFDKGLPVIGPAEDDDDRAEIARLTKVYVIADGKGHVSKGTTDRAFDALTDSSEIRSDLSQIRKLPPTLFRSIQGDEDGPYEVIATIVLDDLHREWYMAVGRSVAGDKEVLAKFQRNYLIFLALASLLCTGASWYSAGRGLRALQSVEQAAKGITGSNLGLQIPQRGANDELDRLVGSFNQMSRRLKASFDQVRQFSTDVSHELRTPLTAIQGQLEVALFTATRPEQLREAIENALQDVERLTNLVRALLLLSQSETGQIPMNKSRLDLHVLLSDLVEQFQIPAEADNLTLQCIDHGPVYCEVDRTQIERVITNLLSNAIKYTQSGGWIRAWTEQAGVSVKLVVQDTGLGIPPDHLPRIFERFYRVPDPNPEKGLGLGLSFVASIVRAHDGEIHVESEVGSGSTFTVTLPAPSVPAPTEDLVAH